MTDRIPAQELPSILQWHPSPIYDPVPEWWLRGLEGKVAAEIVATRLETIQKMLAVQAEGLAQAAKIIRSQG